MSKAFYAIVANSLLAATTNASVWFAVTFWAYLATRSVVVMSVMAGIYLITVACSGFFLGSLVDRYPRKTAMLCSSLGTLVLFALAGGILLITPAAAFADAASPMLWVFIVLALAGAVAGNLRGIALSTLVTIMVPPAQRDRANGLVGSANGVAFLLASILSGLAIGFLGMLWTLACAITLTMLVLLHLALLPIPQGSTSQAGGERQRIDIRGSVNAIRRVPGLFGLIFFHSFNNFLSGVYMSLLDAYGLELVSVQTWGALWGFLSLGFIVGGLVVARKGLGPDPLRAIFVGNIVIWSICMVFTIQPSIVLLAVGMFIFLCLIPAIEAGEQTILQQVIPAERQGRVFGLAQSVEQAASPLTAFLIGPIAQLVFIPFMTTGAGVELIGGWFGTGVDRGIALLFSLSGLIGLIVTLLALRSRAYRLLSRSYAREVRDEAPRGGAPTLEPGQA